MMECRCAVCVLGVVVTPGPHPHIPMWLSVCHTTLTSSASARFGPCWGHTIWVYLCPHLIHSRIISNGTPAPAISILEAIENKNRTQWTRWLCHNNNIHVISAVLTPVSLFFLCVSFYITLQYASPRKLLLGPLSFYEAINGMGSDNIVPLHEGGKKAVDKLLKSHAPWVPCAHPKSHAKEEKNIRAKSIMNRWKME